ncbi:MAG: type IV pilus assembly protein PilM [bacterium]|nr:type IV pilus assembly protein PilM [bacterium]
MFKAKTPIGVDIGSHTVKVCQMRRVGDRIELEKFGAAEIYPSGDRPTDARAQFDAKVAALKAALEQAGIKARQSVSSVCGESIIVRYLQLPEMPEDELKKALQWEAEEYIPFRLSEVNIDSVILGHNGEGDHPRMDILLVSARKDLIESHVAMLRAAGLEPRAIEVDSFAFFNCFELNHKPGRDECVALVNMGNEITSINILSSGVSRFSRDIPVGGDTMTTAIKSRLGCSFAEAERLKIAHGAPHPEALSSELDLEPSAGGSLMDTIRGTAEELAGRSAGGTETPEAVAAKAVQNVVNNLISEIRRSIEFFENQYRGQNVSRLVIGGGTSMLPNLAATFERELRLPVETLNPLKNIQVNLRGDRASRIDDYRQQLGVGIGLGLHGLMA